MASGLALVAPHSGGILSYADKSCSWLVPPNAIAFAGAIRDASDGAFDLEEMGQRGRAFIEREGTFERSAAQYHDLFDRLIGRARVAA